MQLTIETITPAKAKHYLAGNTINRVLRKDRVKFYADQMGRGEWRVSPQGVVLDTNGVLLDGQHRLKAIIESGVTVDMAVVRGADNTVFEVLDSGLARSVADRSGLSNLEVAVCSLAVDLVSNARRSRQARSIDEIGRTYEALSPGFDRFHQTPMTTRRRVTVAPVVLAVLLHTLESRGEYANVQFGHLCRLDVGAFTPTVAAFYRQVVADETGCSITNRPEYFLRAYKGLDEATPNLTKIVFRDTAIALRAVVSKLEKYVG